MKGLRATKLFAEMPDSVVRDLEQAAQVKVFKSGEIIFQEGDPGDGLYVVVQGKVQITALVAENQRRELTHINAGDFFGEMSVLDGEPRSAGAFAEDETNVYFIPRDDLLAALERSPALARRMLRDFSRRMREFDRLYVQEALQAERLGLVGRFARSIIHDFKNPLHIIGVSAELTAIKGTTWEAQLAAKNRIRRQVDRISKMIAGFLEFTRGEKSTVNLLETDYAAFVREVIEEIQPDALTRSVSIEFDNQPPSVNLLLDPTRLTQVFYNLTNNACDAMPGGGRIKLRFSQNDQEVITEIQDTGHGIAPQVISRLFEPFVTYGKSGGTGLGLSICKKIIEDHNGSIRVRSERGCGAVFVFSLPLLTGSPPLPLEAIC